MDVALTFARQILDIGKRGLTSDDREQVRRLMLDCLLFPVSARHLPGPRR
jgi:hypothetical protein